MGNPSISLCMPAWGRFELTEIMLARLARTFEDARGLGVECACVVVAHDANLDTARGLGFATIEAPNVLGAKYNDGHEWALRQGFGCTFQVNTDQAFDAALLARLARAAEAFPGRMLGTRWLTAVHSMGRKAVTTWNPVWSMTAYPTKLLEANPRPCGEGLTRLCDTGVREGVRAANPGVESAWVQLHPLETLQFESGTQLTPWSRHLRVAALGGRSEGPVPWPAIAGLHGEDFTRRVRRFYGQEGA